MLAGKIKEYALRIPRWNSQITSLKAPNRHENGLDNKTYGFGVKLKIKGELQ